MDINVYKRMFNSPRLCFSFFRLSFLSLQKVLSATWMNPEVLGLREVSPTRKGQILLTVGPGGGQVRGGGKQRRLLAGEAWGWVSRLEGGGALGGRWGRSHSRGTDASEPHQVSPVSRTAHHRRTPTSTLVPLRVRAGKADGGHYWGDKAG